MKKGEEQDKRELKVSHKPKAKRNEEKQEQKKERKQEVEESDRSLSGSNSGSLKKKNSFTEVHLEAPESK